MRFPVFADQLSRVDVRNLLLRFDRQELIHHLADLLPPAQMLAVELALGETLEKATAAFARPRGLSVDSPKQFVRK